MENVSKFWVIFFMLLVKSMQKNAKKDKTRQSKVHVAPEIHCVLAQIIPDAAFFVSNGDDNSENIINNDDNSDIDDSDDDSGEHDDDDNNKNESSIEGDS